MASGRWCIVKDDPLSRSSGQARMTMLSVQHLKLKNRVPKIGLLEDNLMSAPRRCADSNLKEKRSRYESTKNEEKKFLINCFKI
jgi:hypothetical protein